MFVKHAALFKVNKYFHISVAYSFSVSFFKAPTEITDDVTEWVIMWGGSGWPITHPEARNGNGADYYPGSGRCHIMHRDLGKPGGQHSGVRELTWAAWHTGDLILYTQAHSLCLTNPFNWKKKNRFWSWSIYVVYVLLHNVQIDICYSTLQYALPAPSII